MTLEKPKREYHQVTEGAIGVYSFTNTNIVVLKGRYKGDTFNPYSNSLREFAPWVVGPSVLSEWNYEGWQMAFELPLEFLQ